MAVTLGTNIPSYTARVNLNQATDDLAKVMERLSSGLKINRAGDDAAGLVISQNMEATVRGSKQAQANIQTATSFLTVAEDGMVSIGGHFQRINDLLVNMANDTNDIQSRTAAVREIIERIEEINRLAETTNFNGRNMLAGNPEPIIVQMGPDSSLNSTLDISKALTDCHVKAFSAELPGYLHPEAKIHSVTTGGVTTERVVVPVEDAETKTVTYYYEDTLSGDEADWEEYDAATNGAVDTLESAFEPTNENCRKYMATIQEAIADLSTRRGLLGAYENRMLSSYDSMTTRIEALETAKTTYTDADIAEEATNMTSKQILQQINVAMLQQANSLQQTALALLGG